MHCTHCSNATSARSQPSAKRLDGGKWKTHFTNLNAGFFHRTELNVVQINP